CLTTTAPSSSSTLSLHDALPICCTRRSFSIGYQLLGGPREVLNGHRHEGSVRSTRSVGNAERSARNGVEAAGVEPASENVSERRSEEHTSELQSLRHLVCRLLLE